MSSVGATVFSSVFFREDQTTGGLTQNNSRRFTKQETWKQWQLMHLHTWA